MCDYIFSTNVSDPTKRGAHPQQYSLTRESSMIIERHVAIPLRNSFHAFADIYRPEDESVKVAPLISWTPYGKHNPAPIHKTYPNSGVDLSWISEYTGFEEPDPLYWTKHGYAVVVVDVPGTWLGDGKAIFSSGQEEAESFYDTIEWIAACPWSSGKVGLSGVSYLAVSQWHVAALKPPSLGCIVPVEGWTDFYREVFRHGGIPCTSFFPYIAMRWGASVNPVEDLIREADEHPFLDALWETKKAQLEKIEVPAFVIASFSDQGLHTRGTLEGFKKISSSEKWLIVHRRRKWEFYYTPEIVEKQRAFYDKFLKGCPDTQVEKWPRALIEVGDRYYEGKWRSEVEWPLSRQVLTQYFIDGTNGSLNLAPPDEPVFCQYHSLGSGPWPVRAQFEMKFPTDVEITGHISAKLYMETLQGDDIDVFVAIYKLDRSGNMVGQTIYAQYDDGAVCLGWLRASHREKDPSLSKPEQPILLHQREQKLQAGKVYELEIEVLASSMVYHSGESLCLIVQGTDIYKRTHRRFPPEVLTRHESEQVNRGLHRLWTGGEYQSQLLVPIIPQ